MIRHRNPLSALIARGTSLLRLFAVVIALAAHGALLAHQFDHALHPAEQAEDCTLCHFASTALPEPDVQLVIPPLQAETLRFVSQYLDVLAASSANSRPPPRAPPVRISA